MSKKQPKKPKKKSIKTYDVCHSVIIRKIRTIRATSKARAIIEAESLLGTFGEEIDCDEYECMDTFLWVKEVI